ncbi:MAG: riboflavin biosynthesis protein RibF [Ruminococcus sp.]|nr:riboflavin biosynthesis protein RibF [Ruminococcus sp.]
MSYKTSIAIGLFDGVHLGHKAVLETAVKIGIEQGFTPSAVTFMGDISPQKNVKLILSEKDRVNHIKQYGIKEVFRFDFNEIKNLKPIEFILKLRDNYGAWHIVCGEDFRFGKDRAGDINTLALLCEKLGIGFTVTPELLINGEKISSGKIRSLLENREIKAANELLGYDFYYKLKVIHGKEIGRKLGFPTINQFIPNEFIRIKNGVYLSKIEVDEKTYSGITNYGNKPTVDYAGEPILETYIDAFDGEIYGKNVKVFPKKYLRPEMKFNNLDELKLQIEEDKKHIYEWN